MLGRQIRTLVLAVSVLGLAGSARAQGFGMNGGFGGAAFTSQGFGMTGFGVPAAVSSGAWGLPGGFGYGGYVPAYGYGGYSPYGYGVSPYAMYGNPYGYGGGYNGVFYPFPIVAPPIGNNLGGMMGAIRGTTGRGTWGR